VSGDPERSLKLQEGDGGLLCCGVRRGRELLVQIGAEGTSARIGWHQKGQQKETRKNVFSKDPIGIGPLARNGERDE